jgi:CreA protein
MKRLLALLCVMAAIGCARADSVGEVDTVFKFIALGLAEDKSEASIACRQVGPISFTGPLPAQEEMFTERISLVFKRIRVVRMVDRKRNTLVYLTYSDRVIEGSPQNSVTAVPVDRATVIPVK